MSVQGKMIEITLSGGAASGYYVDPGGDKKPGLIVIHEWWGLNEQIKEVAARFAEHGFAVIAPDLYQ
jgi:carboxymethylenebutenolidase